MTDPTPTPDAPAQDLSKATPRPWRAGFYSSIVGLPVMAQPDPAENSVVVLTMVGDREECEANAALIVAAVNAYNPAALRAEHDEAQPVAWDSDFRAEIERIADDYHPCGGERDIAIALDEMREALQAALETHPPATSPGADQPAWLAKAEKDMGHAFYADVCRMEDAEKAAHEALDRAGVPRDDHGTEAVLTLVERIDLLQAYRQEEVEDAEEATSPGAAGDAEQALSDDTIEAIVYAVLNTGHIDSAKAAVRAVLEGEHAP